MTKFQSSPALSDGRYDGVVPYSRFHPINVSILARPFGRALLRLGSSWCLRIWVSILARPFGRALFFEVTALHAAIMFQSSPALSDGRYSLGWWWRISPALVSILARPFGRALYDTIKMLHINRLFQSSPALSDGRYYGVAQYLW